MVHSEEDYNMAVEASGILFGKATKDALLKLDEQTLLDVFNGVPQFHRQYGYGYRSSYGYGYDYGYRKYSYGKKYGYGYSKYSQPDTEEI